MGSTQNVHGRHGVNVKTKQNISACVWIPAIMQTLIL